MKIIDLRNFAMYENNMQYDSFMLHMPRVIIGIGDIPNYLPRIVGVYDVLYRISTSVSFISVGYKIG